jgi:aminopeptidase
MAWQIEKESRGRWTWTVALYGTQAMADEAGMSIDSYWEQIVSACFLDDPDPKERWREVQRQMNAHLEVLNGLPIDRLHVEGEDADLWITLGERRRWVGAPTRNIPSFEIFTSPDWRGTEGWITFSEPLYVFGKLIRRARLEFREGRVTGATAAENEDLLKSIIATKGADRVGESSLTDRRLSRITRFMANTLFDQNVGGRYGNTHLAVGQSYPQECFDGDPSGVTADELRRLGFNESAVHTDIVSTTDRTVTATLAGGSRRVIYADGQFVD